MIAVVSTLPTEDPPSGIARVWRFFRAVGRRLKRDWDLGAGPSAFELNAMRNGMSYQEAHARETGDSGDDI